MATNDFKSPIHSTRDRRWYSIQNFTSTVPVRWLGFILAVSGITILSSANVETQWVGWTVSTISCGIWVYMGYKDRDWPRMLMELVYVFLSIRAVMNWLGL